MADMAVASDFPSGRWSFGQTCQVSIEPDAMGAGMVLTRKGIVTGMSACEFVQIWPGEEDRWAVMELCSGNDSTWTRISALERSGSGELIHTSENEGELVFTLCPGTEEDYPGTPEPAQPAIPEDLETPENTEPPENTEIPNSPEAPESSETPEGPETPESSKTKDSTTIPPANQADAESAAHESATQSAN
ncbi:MAG: hypothetical protein ACTSSQ_04190 [Alphaproteobacteria bacterium]